MQPKKRALGKGLGALLPPKPVPAAKGKAAPAAEAAEGSVAVEVAEAAGPYHKLKISELKPNTYQPRDHFDAAALEELASSIKMHGLIQPIAVTKHGNSHMIVAGERRWRAAQIAGLEQVPVIVIDVGPREMLEFALIENLQRENLNPIEEGRAYRALIETFELSQDEVAERVGKSRPAVANALRLLKLPDDIQKDIEGARISAGHARALLGLSSETAQRRLRDLIIQHELSVRQAERLVSARADSAEKKAGGAGNGKSASSTPKSPDAARLQEALIDRLACRVSVKTFDENRGKVEIHFDSLDELQRFMEALGVSI